MNSQPENILAKIDELVLDKVMLITDPELSKGPVKANIKLYGDLIKWYRTDRSYEGWLALSKEYYYSDAFMNLDTDGNIRHWVDQYFSIDLKPHFDKHTHLDEKDIELLAVKMKALQSVFDSQ